MIKDFFNDAVKAVQYFDQQRKNRKEKKAPVKVLPIYKQGPAFYNTIEGCTLSNCSKMADAAGRMAFNRMPYDLQKAMMLSTPEQGDFVERAHLWRTYLRLVAPDKHSHVAMVSILSWYRHIKHIRTN